MRLDETPSPRLAIPRWMVVYGSVWICLLYAVVVGGVYVAVRGAFDSEPLGPGIDAWRTEREAGRLGGIGGAVGGGLGALIGTLGGVIGTLCGMGKAKGLVLALTDVVIVALAAMTVAGAACLMIGVLALIEHQPYWVYYPLLLMGAISTTVCGGQFPGIVLMKTHVIARAYEMRELRKMQAMDLR